MFLRWLFASLHSSPSASAPSRAGRWVLDVPSIFEEEAMIEAAREQLNGANVNPMLIARTAGDYSALALIPKGYKRMLDQRQVAVV